VSFDYAGLRDDTVQPLLAEFGKVTPGQISVNVPATGAPYESQIGTPVLYPCTVVQTVFKKSDNNGTLVEAGDVLFLVSPEGLLIDPELADRILVDGVTYQVVRVDPLKPGSTIMLWKVHGRK